MLSAEERERLAWSSALFDMEKEKAQLRGAELERRRRLAAAASAWQRISAVPGVRELIGERVGKQVDRLLDPQEVGRRKITFEAEGKRTVIQPVPGSKRFLEFLMVSHRTGTGYDQLKLEPIEAPPLRPDLSPPDESGKIILFAHWPERRLQVWHKTDELGDNPEGGWQRMSAQVQRYSCLPIPPTP